MAKRVSVASWSESRKYWKINVQKNGIRRSFYCSVPGRKGKSECHRKADEWLEDNIANTNEKVSVIFEKWLAELLDTTSQTHVKQYSSYNNCWITPNIGNIKICNITEQHLQEIINKGYKKGLSKKSLSNIKACLLAFLKYCRKCKYTTLFPESLYIPRNAQKGERTILQPDDIKILFSDNTTLYRGKEKEDFYINAYRFDLLTGLRPGELIGLQWNDIKNDIVTIKRAINVDNITTKGKNENANRQFALSSTSKGILKNQKQLQSEYGLNSKYVFCSIYGEPIKERNLLERWTAYRDYHELSKCTLYELRHTFVSIAKMLPTGMIKPIIGHSDAMDTIGTYGHELNGEKKTVANELETVFKKYLP